MSTPFLRRSFSLTPLLLAAALVACGGGDDDPATPEQPPENSAPGALLSGSMVNTITPAQITQAFKDPESHIQSGIVPRYSVSSYRLNYVTTDKNGAKVTASGLVSVPVKAAGARSPVLSYQHASTFRNNQAPSIKVEAVEPPLVLASLGYIVVSPDYVGFGASYGVEHPYLTSSPSSRAVIDMLSAWLLRKVLACW